MREQSPRPRGPSIGRMQDAQVIVLATPVFFLLIAIEAIVGWRRRRVTYAWSDTLNSIGLGMMSPVSYTHLTLPTIYSV